VCCSSSKPQGGQESEEGNNQLLYTVGMTALWIGLSVYGFMLSPNQTPTRDMIFLKLLVGIREPGEDFVVNQVYTALFNIMGIWPAVYASLLVPAGRSENKLPAWPFIAGSFGFGVFALLPYFAFWRPIKDQNLPPPKEELEGWDKLFMKGAETPVLPALLIAGASSMLYLAATAGAASWVEYGRLLDESRLVHVTTLDFLCLTAFAPFWMLNDAEARGWEQRNTLLPILSVLPAVGPAIYLLLRPKTDMSK